MIVVADTGPLNYLIRLGYVGLLERLYGKVIVPDAVFEEMLHAGAPAEVREWARDLPAWAESVSSPQIFGSLPPWLGAGESAAILLAEAVCADLVLMDEYRGRKVALARGLK